MAASAEVMLTWMFLLLQKAVGSQHGEKGGMTAAQSGHRFKDRGVMPTSRRLVGMEEAYPTNFFTSMMSRKPASTLILRFM